MNYLNLSIKSFLILSLTVLSTTGCLFNKNHPEEKLIPLCIEGQVPCSHSIKLGQSFEGDDRLDSDEIALLFGVKKVVSESPFIIHLKYEGSNKLKNVTAYLSGKEMYMGKIPLIFSPVSGAGNTFKATGLVGSCTDKKMRWSMVVSFELETKQNEVLQETKVFEFVSFQS